MIDILSPRNRSSLIQLRAVNLYNRYRSTCSICFHFSTSSLLIESELSLNSCSFCDGADFVKCLQKWQSSRPGQPAYSNPQLRPRDQICCLPPSHTPLPYALLTGGEG